MLLFVFNVNSTGLRTRACAFNLQVPYPRSNSGKRTSAYSATTLFNCLDTDLKQIACVSPSSIIFSSRLNNFKHKLFILFLKFASNVSHLEELMCYDCRFSLYCNCIRRVLVYTILYHGRSSLFVRIKSRKIHYK